MGFKLQKKGNDGGFSTVELIMTVAIMATLIGVMTAIVTGQLEKAKETAAMVNAEALFKTAQVAVINASVDTKDSFYYAVKYEETINGQTMRVGRFSNQSLYKYLQESKGGGSLSEAKSKETDYYIAEIMSGAVTGADGDIADATLKNKSPIGDTHSVKYMAEHPETYGNVVFALAYTANAEIVYFQCIYNGYYFYSDGRSFQGKKVSDSIKFNDWPSHRFQQAADESW